MMFGDKKTFEEFVAEEIIEIGKKVASIETNQNNGLNEIKQIKDNVADLCKRTTVIETERDVKLKSHDNQIKILSVIISAIGVIFGVLQGLRFMKLG